MKTLEEHNEERYTVYRRGMIGDRVMAGVACSRCGTEMHFSEVSALLLSEPPKMKVECVKCGHNDYMVMS